MSGLLSEITQLWADIAFKKTTGYKDPDYFSLPQEIRDNLESGEEKKVREGFRSIIQDKIPVSQATLKYIEERFDPNLEK